MSADRIRMYTCAICTLVYQAKAQQAGIKRNGPGMPGLEKDHDHDTCRQYQDAAQASVPVTDRAVEQKHGRWRGRDGFMGLPFLGTAFLGLGQRVSRTGCARLDITRYGIPPVKLPFQALGAVVPVSMDVNEMECNTTWIAGPQDLASSSTTRVSMEARQGQRYREPR
jgi:hypothetical protein